MLVYTSTETYCALLSTAVGKPYGKLPMSLDWISCAYHCTITRPLPCDCLIVVHVLLTLRIVGIPDDFYRLNNVSWLQPMCEYPQNLYTRMAPHHRAVLL